MSIIATPTVIPDVLVIEPKFFMDDRGWFSEIFHKNEFSDAVGYSVDFVQDNYSYSQKGVLRGLHYQLEHVQGKLVRVCRGAVFDVAVDLRESSNTFGSWVGVELSDSNKKQLWIPPGFAHGFLVLSDEAEFLYKTTDYWHPSSEMCIAWNDKNLNIDWPTIDVDFKLSLKDSAGLKFSSAPKFDCLNF